MSECIYQDKQIRPNGDIVEMRIWRVPVSSANPEGIAYSCAYIRKGKRLIAYDNENHGTGKSHHHKHIKDRIVQYEFIDEWRVVEDFVSDMEKIERGEIK